MTQEKDKEKGRYMVLLEPFPISPLHDVILRTVIKAEDAEDIEAVMVFRFYTEDKRKKDND